MRIGDASTRNTLSLIRFSSRQEWGVEKPATVKISRLVEARILLNKTVLNSDLMVEAMTIAKHSINNHGFDHLGDLKI